MNTTHTKNQNSPKYKSMYSTILRKAANYNWPCTVNYNASLEVTVGVMRL